MLQRVFGKPVFPTRLGLCSAFVGGVWFVSIISEVLMVIEPLNPMLSALIFAATFVRAGGAAGLWPQFAALSRVSFCSSREGRMPPLQQPQTLLQGAFPLP